MAPRFPRRRRDAETQQERSREPDDADLDAEEHAWWAQRTELSQPWSTPATEELVESPRDVLAEHLGEDWRTQFGLDPSKPAESVDREVDGEEIDEEIDEAIDTSDPYAVLGVDPTASWEDIVIAHRAEARRHHPDRMVGRSEAAVARSERRIRDINVAYQELRIRRGR